MALQQCAHVTCAVDRVAGRRHASEMGARRTRAIRGSSRVRQRFASEPCLLAAPARLSTWFAPAYPRLRAGAQRTDVGGVCLPVFWYETHAEPARRGGTAPARSEKVQPFTRKELFSFLAA